MWQEKSLRTPEPLSLTCGEGLGTRLVHLYVVWIRGHFPPCTYPLQQLEIMYNKGQMDDFQRDLCTSTFLGLATIDHFCYWKWTKTWSKTGLWEGVGTELSTSNLPNLKLKLNAYSICHCSKALPYNFAIHCLSTWWWPLNMVVASQHGGGIEAEMTLNACPL